jgi:ribosome-binding factor A
MPPRESTRMRRIDTALRAVLSEVIARDLSDPRLGMVTITGVRASTDLRSAKVFYTVLEPSRRRTSQEALESARGLLQARVGAELRTRNTPHLDFVHDERQERAVALTRLIDEAVDSLEGP